MKNNIFPLSLIFKKIKFEHVEDWCDVYVYIYNIKHMFKFYIYIFDLFFHLDRQLLRCTTISISPYMYTILLITYINSLYLFSSSSIFNCIKSISSVVQATDFPTDFLFS